MKRILNYVALVCVAFAMASCVQDLNTKPIDPNSSTSFNQDRMFTKCYACLAVIGQSGPGGDSDVEDLDAGTSGFYRMIWYLNDLPSDEAWWIWKDPEQPEVLETSDWNGETKSIPGIYTRLNLDVKYCNHYITYASDESDEDKYRKAEVRFIRALHYYYLMDMFLYMPFVTEDSNEFPHFKPRHEIYAWLVQELKELETLLPAHRITKYRVGKAAAQLLLARIYLNADVYNKYNPSWSKGSALDEALSTATATINDNKGIHDLVVDSIVTDSGYVYTAYQRLFMGDNHNDDVIKESLLQIYQDGLYAQSYASTLYLIAGPRIKGLTPWGIESEWHALRTSPTLIDKFLKTANPKKDRSDVDGVQLDEFKMPRYLHDDRAIFCSDSMNTGSQFSLTGPMGLGDNSNFFECWGGMKFTGVYSTAAEPRLSPRQSTSWPDTDIPFLRLAEAYMIQAEAKFRKGDVAGALDIINNTIRKRANADPLPSLDEETLLDEWCREFWFEGRRRIDLIRFGRFLGKDANTYRYQWEGRMNQKDVNMGGSFKEGEDYMNWFPVPTIDKRANPNYKIDVEGDASNIFAAQGGDGYIY